MEQNNPNNLPAVVAESFLPVKVVKLLDLPEEILNELSEVDADGYMTVPPVLPYVSIRGDDLKDAGGNIVLPEGNFKMQDKTLELVQPDVSKDDGLLVTVISDKETRVWFEKIKDPQPSCKSYDAITGIGMPGGTCAACPLSKFIGKESPKCKLQYNLICFDYVYGGPYIYVVGTGSLKYWRTFRQKLERQTERVGGKTYKIPPHFAKIMIKSVYRTIERDKVPSDFFASDFEVVETIAHNVLVELKKKRKEYLTALETTIHEYTPPPEMESNTQGNYPDGGREIPSDVTAIKEYDKTYQHNSKIEGATAKEPPVQNSRSIPTGENDDLPF